MGLHSIFSSSVTNRALWLIAPGGIIKGFWICNFQVSWIHDFMGFNDIFYYYNTCSFTSQTWLWVGRTWRCPPMGQHVRQTPPLPTYPVRLPSMGCSGPAKDGMPYNRGWGYGYRWEIPSTHDDVIKWKHFPRYWPFVRGIHRWPVNSPHKGQCHGALMTISLICASINGWVNNCEAVNCDANAPIITSP